MKMAEQLEMMSSDMIRENIEYITNRFPNTLKEIIDEKGKVVKKIDFDVLKQELSSVLIEDKQERYQLTWPNKKNAILLANSRINGTLRPDKAKSVNFDDTKNIYIEGDNLDVLKLLRETYLNKVKMIYIDPPYNTGNDFVYGDDFSQSSEDYLKNSGQYDDQGNRLFTNNESNGRFHTDWLNMMYPRLKIAKDVLADDGVMFISIDDNEVNNLKKICDEIFGESCFVTTLHVELSATQGMKVKAAQMGNIVKNAEYVLVYSKDGHKDIAKRILYDFRPEYDSHYSKFLMDDMKMIDVKDAFSKQYPHCNLTNLTDMYSDSQEFRSFVDKNVDRIFADDKISGIDMSDYPEGKVYLIKKGDREYYIYNNGSKIRQLLPLRASYGECDDFRQSYGLRKIRGDWWKDFYRDMGNVSKEGDVVFANGKKPVRLISQLIKMCTNDDDIVLDFFSGSATTAHAVMLENSRSGGNRRFIMVQLPEADNEDDGYATICDLGEDRIKKSGLAIKEAWAKGQNSDGLFATQEQFNVDIGFRVLKLDSSNMNDVYYNPNSLNQTLLDSTVDNVKPDRSNLDLLFQIMLELGVELSAKIEERSVCGKQFFVVNENDIVACFDDKITDEVTKELAKIHPIYAVFKDSSFDSDSSNINCEQIFKSISPSTTIKVI